MGLFKSTTYEKATEMSKPFTPFTEDLYTVMIDTVQVVETDETVWEGSTPVKTDNKVDQIQIDFIMQETSSGGEILDVNGEPANYNGMKLWIDPLKTGTSRRGPTKARQFLCAAMGWPIDAEINLQILEDLIVNDKLKGQQLKIYVSVNTRPDGSKNNKIEKFTAMTVAKSKK
jgi:hypothetical protein